MAERAHVEVDEVLVVLLGDGWSIRSDLVVAGDTEVLSGHQNAGAVVSLTDDIANTVDEGRFSCHRDTTARLAATSGCG
jgi:hypothetical protein